MMSVPSDKYMKEGQGCNLFLKAAVLSELELLIVPNRNPKAEICDAITRLWLPENEAIYEKLKQTIRSYAIPR